MFVRILSGLTAAWLALVPSVMKNHEAAQVGQTTIRTEVALVNVVFSATDRNQKAVTGLKAEDFLVYEDRKPQEIEYFSDWTEGSDVPLTIALLIDTSGSVKSRLDYEKQTAMEFFNEILRKNQDLALIIQFDSEVNLVQDFTEDIDRLTSALDTLQAGNSTALYDAVYLATEEKLKYEAGRKVMVVITDGSDTSSKISEKEALETAQRSDVIIYGIGVRGDNMVNFGVLKKFAEDTGGSFFSPNSKLEEIRAAFRAIGQDLKGQYSLAYRSTNPKRDGTFRSIDLRCKISGVRIRARRGYYAAKSNKKDFSR
jgi:Ca-activated chloride channel family protein